MGAVTVPHRSNWSTIYWDNDPNDAFKLKPYVRLTPGFMGLESVGFPHGIGLAGFFETEEKAVAFAKRVDAFMDELKHDILNGDADD